MRVASQNVPVQVSQLREDFPILSEQVHGKPLVYLDNAATTQKPKSVLDTLQHYYLHQNSNVHRGAHFLSAQATEAYEQARETVARFINAPDARCVNFVRGTTEAINLVAQSYGRKMLRSGDEILLTVMDHHSNLVPWQALAQEVGAVVKYIPITSHGTLDLTQIHPLINEKTKIVSLAYVSNALGTIHPVADIIQKAHAVGAVVMLDSAQAAGHGLLDVQSLDADFIAFSGHKLFGPTGIGILWGKEYLLESMDPYMYGGEMIQDVTLAGTTFQGLPFKFEAGTPNIAGAIGLAAAIQYFESIPSAWIQEHEQLLLDAATERLLTIPGLRIIGTSAEKVSVVSFVVEGVHPYDIGVLLDQQGIAIRTGHHCCQPLMNELQLEGTCRASFSFYNTLEEVDRLYTALLKTLELLD